MKVAAIIQARMGSTRLPGKVLLDLAGEPMLARVVNRAERAQTLDDVVVATTVHPHDEAIVRLCTERGWLYFRGSEDDVLDRYYQATLACQADAIVRITADCPLIEPAIVDRLVRRFLDQQPGADYVCNLVPRRTYPRGMDAEVMSLKVLEQAWRDCHEPAWREHVTTFILRNPDLFQIHGIANEVSYSHMRWTVDTPEDLALVRHIYKHFGHDHFSWAEVLALLKEHPEWLDINSDVQQRIT